MAHEEPPLEMPSVGDEGLEALTFDVEEGEEGAHRAAAKFALYGMCILKNLLTPALALEARVQGLRTFEGLQEEADKRGVAIGVGTCNGFREIVCRSKGRFEMPYKMREGVFCRKEVKDISYLKRFMQHAMRAEAKLCGQNLLVSFPEAEGMHWHTDGRHLSSMRHLRAHAVNVFVALGDVTLPMGPTELRPASHFITRNLTKMMLAAKVRKQLHKPVVPELSSGDALVFDYRTLHKGLPNSTTDPRVLLELVYFKDGFKDLLNFPKRSLFDQDKGCETESIGRPGVD